MGKSIRSKRMKKLRSIKREKLQPREMILLQQRAAIIQKIKGENVNEAEIPVLPEVLAAPERFVHTRDGSAPIKKTLDNQFGNLVQQNAAANQKEQEERLKKEQQDEEFDRKFPKKARSLTRDEKRALHAVKQEPAASTTPSRGRNRDVKSLTSSNDKNNSRNPRVKVEKVDSDDDEAMVDADSDAALLADVRDPEFGASAKQLRGDKQLHKRVRSALRKRRKEAIGKNGFINWHKL